MSLTILHGDAIEKLRELPDESVQCCVTSPPYWGLRDYGTATWYGGDEHCDHKQFNAYPTGLMGSDDAQRNGKFFKNQCRKCGAEQIDAQIGLEETPDAYMAKIVDVFREVRRVLKNNGTLWLNLGDSYAAGCMTGKQGANSTSGVNLGQGSMTALPPRKPQLGFKPKDLCGIPWRVAFALQADGWYLRSDIIWSKPNPMPESVTDRPTKAHEYLFLLSKQERYFYDAEAIKERVSDATIVRAKASNNGITRKDGGDAQWQGGLTPCQQDRYYSEICEESNRNKRSVWTVATAPYAEAHFATYPPDLIKPCILAGTKSGDTVLDPFAGSGTTGMVAIEFGRKAILIELNSEYIPLINQRCSITPGFAL